MSNRMFAKCVTWNPAFGCSYGCVYCWARIKFAHRFGIRFKSKKMYNFVPHLLLHRSPSKSERPRIFVVAHGDLFCDGFKDEEIYKVLELVADAKTKPFFKGKVFFFETKNPIRFNDFLELFPDDSVLSSTIETNRDYGLNRAPLPVERYEAMRDLDWSKKHISIEPIIDFDFDMFLNWMKDIQPIDVAVGRNSIKNVEKYITEPSRKKAERLKEELEKFTEVEKKKDWW